MTDSVKDAQDQSPEAMRAHTIEEIFVPYVRKAFAQNNELKSAKLSIAQYYCDEANDAVHERVSFSTCETPGLYTSERAGGLVRDTNYMGWDENYSAIRAFAAYCPEDAGEAYSSYRPYAIARRVGADAIEVEIVGTLARPWAELGAGVVPEWAEESGEEPFTDGVVAEPWPQGSETLLEAVYAHPDDEAPRAVFADWLQQKGDVRGEFVAWQLQKELSDDANQGMRAMIEARGRAFLGSLVEVVPRSSSTFARGFVDSVGVYVTEIDPNADWYSDPSWATVRSIFFYAGSATFVTPAMRGAHFLGPLDCNGLADLKRVGAPPRLEVLDVDLSEEKSVALLSTISLPPSIHTLRVRSSSQLGDALSALKKAAWWPLLERLEILRGAALAEP